MLASLIQCECQQRRFRIRSYSADELEKLANLQQRGALTDEEFQAENSKLLA